MSWFNRIIGGGLGFFFGGPIGSIIGLTIGHMLDKSNESSGSSHFLHSSYSKDSIQMAFFASFFSLLAKVARADGRISEQEGRHFLEILDKMSLKGEVRQFAIATFNNAKDSRYNHKEFAIQLREIANTSNYDAYGSNAVILQSFFYTLVGMAAIDGHISRAEDQILREIAEAFGFGETIIRQAYSQFQISGAVQMDTAYEVLGVPPEANDEEVRDAYRKLVKETHPDKLMQHGLPPEMKASAEKRFHEIQEAWEQIRKQRGIS